MSNRIYEVDQEDFDKLSTFSSYKHRPSINMINLAGVLFQVKETKSSRMTRQEAEQKVSKVCDISLDAGNIVRALEALGILKFDEPNKEAINYHQISGGRMIDKFGVLRFEEWPEGLVIWVGGKIVYKSWEKN